MKRSVARPLGRRCLSVLRFVSQYGGALAREAESEGGR